MSQLGLKLKTMPFPQQSGPYEAEIMQTSERLQQLVTLPRQKKTNVILDFESPYLVDKVQLKGDLDDKEGLKVLGYAEQGPYTWQQSQVQFKKVPHQACLEITPDHLLDWARADESKLQTRRLATTVEPLLFMQFALSQTYNFLGSLNIVFPTLSAIDPTAAIALGNSNVPLLGSLLLSGKTDLSAEAVSSAWDQLQQLAEEASRCTPKRHYNYEEKEEILSDLEGTLPTTASFKEKAKFTLTRGDACVALQGEHHSFHPAFQVRCGEFLTLMHQRDGKNMTVEEDYEIRTGGFWVDEMHEFRFGWHLNFSLTRPEEDPQTPGPREEDSDSNLPETRRSHTTQLLGV